MFSHLDREVGPNHMDVNVLAMPLKEVKKGGECTQYGGAGGTFGAKETGKGKKGERERGKVNGGKGNGGKGKEKKGETQIRTYTIAKLYGNNNWNFSSSCINNEITLVT